MADVLHILWEERDGPSVDKPATRGFGTKSVIASIESQLGGRADFDWRSEGLVCRLSVPLMHAAVVRQPASRQSLPIAANLETFRTDLIRAAAGE